MTRFTQSFFTLLACIACTGTAIAQDGFCMVNGTTTGGAGGTVVTVTNGTDFNTQINIAGLRIIQVQGPISIGRIFTTANKTVIGLGTNALLWGNLNISGVTNVIVQNLHISGPGGDGLTIWNAQHVWVDHCTFFDCGDGSADQNNGSQYNTVSWCKFLYLTQVAHRFTMIADGFVSGGVTNHGYYTLHHNWWSTGCDQRMAASSHGRIHYYNNYFDCTNNSYCSDARCGTEFVSENNYYSGVKNPIYKECTGLIKTSGNLYFGTIGTAPDAGTDTVFTPPYAYTLDAAANVPALVMAGAGAPGLDTVPVPPKIWDGGGTDNNLTTASNWGFNENPKVYDTLTFAGTTRLAPNNNFATASEFPAIAFSTTAGAFTLGGNAIGLGVGITDDSAAVQTINVNLDFTYGANHYPTNRYFTVSSVAGSLVINKNISGGASNYVFTVIKRGGGILVLNGLNTCVGPVQLNEGTIRFSALATNLPGSLGGGTNLNFDGGALQWAAGNTSDISASFVTISTNGATFDVGGNSVTFVNGIGNRGAGGITKTGTGTLQFNATNNYRGNTLIADGVLALGLSGLLTNSPQIILSNNASLDVSARSDGTQTLFADKSLIGNGTIRGSVTAASGSSLAPGFSIGTLVITNVLTFQSGSSNVMEINATTHTNDLLTGMTTVNYGGKLIVTNLDGTPAAGDSFKLFNAAGYLNSFSSVTLPPLTGNLIWTNRLAVDGTLAIVSSVNTTPTNMMIAVVGNQLQLSWPADHTGWRLQIQTNNMATGMGANWFDVAGSQSTNHMFVPIDPGNGGVFLRLIYP